MSAAITLSGPSLASAHRQFEAALPAMDRTFRYLFRRCPRGRRAELLCEAYSATWHAWYGLLKRGQDPTAVGVTGIAANAARYVKAGRRLGTGTCGRGAMDIFHPRVQRRGGFQLVGLDREAEREPGQGTGAWREWAAGDNRMTPADAAAFKIDLQSWLEQLPARQRRVAELLAEGHQTGLVARMVGVSPARVSQLRGELEASWRQFQAQAAADPGRAVAVQA